MAKHIRNCRLPLGGYNLGGAVTAWFFREAFFVGGWTEDSNDGDAAWASGSNILINDSGSPGFSVNAASPRRIVDLDGAGRFTQAMVDDNAVIALHATNDQNASMWRIIEYIDAHNVNVDPAGFSPFGWVTESTIPGRVTKTDVKVANAAWALMDAPVGNMQARFEKQSAGIYCFVRPAGQAADPTEAPGSNISRFGTNDDDEWMAFNAYMDGDNVLFYQQQDGDNFSWSILWGELDNAVTGDTNPGFVMEGWATEVASGKAYMLSFAVAAEEMQSIFPKQHDTTSAANSIIDLPVHRTVNGRPARVGLYQPLSWMVTDKYIRGNVPMIRFVNDHYPDDQRLDSLGLWRHLKNGLVVPMNGPNDPPLLVTGV